MRTAMAKLQIGSLFSGYGGLDMAVVKVLDAEIAWHSEIDKDASQILAYHYPNIPNHGDITKIDFTQVQPIDILTGGFPCQDLSVAGKRAGLTDGTRSGLWSHYVRAIETLKPKIVIIENVRGILSAKANTDMEYCENCMGDKPDQPRLRALGAVLGNLANLGYDAKWTTVQASSVGAPHRRERVFIVAKANS
jgi:DNA (cytosine-5)-methyltransferase 1